MEVIRDNWKLAIWIERLLWAMFTVYSFIALELLVLMMLNLLKEFEFASRLFELLGPLKNYINTLYFILYIVCIWLFRAYSNIHAVKKEGLYTKSLIVWAWFIPFVNLILPFRVLKSLYSSGLEMTGEAGELQLKKMNRTINDMQILWIFSWVFSGIIFIITFSGYLNQFLEIIGITSLVVQIASVIYILCKIRFVREYSKLDALLVNSITNESDFTRNDNLIDSI